MGKRILQLYAEDADVARAKAKGMNISALFRTFLSIELNDAYKGANTDKIIAKLKSKVANLTTELESKTKEVEQLKKKTTKNKAMRYVPYNG